MQLNLSRKLIACICSLVLFVVVAVIAVGNYVVTSAVQEKSYQDLLKAKDVFLHFQQFRFDKLFASSELAADIPHLRAVIDTPDVDHATILDSVQNVQKIVKSDLFMITDKQGKLLASFSEPNRFGDKMSGKIAFESALQGKYYQGFWTTAKEVFQVVANPVTFDDRVIGTLMIGYVINQEALDQLMEMTNFEIAFVSENRILTAHPNTRKKTPFKSLRFEELVNFSNSKSSKSKPIGKETPQDTSNELITTQDIGDETYILANIFLSDVREKGYYILARSLDYELLFYKMLRKGLFIFSLFILAFSYLIVIFLTKKITRPINFLVKGTQRIAKGDFSTRVKVHSTDEIGQLADSLNQMTEKLKNTTTSMDNLNQEINERKKAEAEIRSLAMFFSENPSPVLRVSKDGIVLYGNDESVSILNDLGCKVGERAPNQWCKLIEEVFASNLKGNLEIVHRNRVFLFELIPLVGESYVNLYGIDITKRKDAEEEKRKLEKQLHQSQRLESIGAVIDSIAHNFNNIFAAARGYVEMAIVDVPPDSRVNTDLKKAIGRIEDAKGLSDKMLRFSKNEAKTLEPVKIHLAIEEAIDLFQTSVTVPIDITKSINAQCGPISANLNEIKQIVMNLCTNAYHAMQETNRTLKVSFDEVEVNDLMVSRFPHLHVGKYGQIIVRDTGKGMDRATMDQIFEPFFSTKKIGGGTGLGLSVIRGIVISHNGEITVDSQIGKGTTVTVYLPLADTNIRMGKKYKV